MASNNRSSMATFLMALLLFTLTNPIANGQITIPPLIPTGLSAVGRLCCTTTGNCPATGAIGVPNALVSLNCTNLLGVSQVVGQALTNATGGFNITVGGLIGVIPSLLTPPCVVTVRLPLNSTVCPLLSATNGILVGTLSRVGNLLTSVFGLVSNLVLGLFVGLSV